MPSACHHTSSIPQHDIILPHPVHPTAQHHTAQVPNGTHQAKQAAKNSIAGSWLKVLKYMQAQSTSPLLQTNTYLVHPPVPSCFVTPPAASAPAPAEASPAFSALSCCCCLHQLVPAALPALRLRLLLRLPTAVCVGGAWGVLHRSAPGRQQSFRW